MQNLLVHKFGHLTAQLEADLGGAKVWVNQVVSDHNTALADAKRAVDDQRDTPVFQTEKALAAAVAAREAAAALLAKWRKPVAAIKARQKAAADLVKEITALATPETHKHGEAYWKLGLDGTEPVAGQPYLKALIEGAPAAVPVAELPDQILAGWNAFQVQRLAAEQAAQALADALPVRKAAEDKAALLDKTLIPSIAQALGAWEDHKAP